MSESEPRVGDQPATAATAPAGDGPSWHPCPPRADCPHCNGTHAQPLLDWSFVDAVYCISLKTRDDRATRVAEEFHRVGLCRYVRFFRPDKHPKKGIIGSWESHRRCSMDAMERGCRNALVLEDDVLFMRNVTPALLREVANTLDGLPPDWHILYLGHWPVEAWFLRPNLLETRSACAHAYIVSPRLMRWIADHPYGTPGIEFTRLVGRALDSAFSRLPGTYAIFPMLATQSISKSDNFNYKPKPKTKLKHLVTRSRYRETLLSHLMRPFELIVVALSPLFWLRHRWRIWRQSGAAGSN
jgi:GR25 family glycosyltransferase involved in LPS biosynthesis